MDCSKTPVLQNNALPSLHLCSEDCEGLLKAACFHWSFHPEAGAQCANPPANRTQRLVTKSEEVFA
jgi:hypothetical protein